MPGTRRLVLSPFLSWLVGCVVSRDVPPSEGVRMGSGVGPSAGGVGGSGPGVIAPDGSAVEFYAALPESRASAALVHEVAGPGATVLELGAGAGRVTRPLLELGHRVVAVDEAPGMLARIQGAETECCPIQDLELGRRFDVVLLMSFFVEYGGAASVSGRPPTACEVGRVCAGATTAVLHLGELCAAGGDARWGVIPVL